MNSFGSKQNVVGTLDDDLRIVAAEIASRANKQGRRIYKGVTVWLEGRTVKCARNNTVVADGVTASCLQIGVYRHTKGLRDLVLEDLQVVA